MKTIRLVLAWIFLLCGNPDFKTASASTDSLRATEDLRGETVFIPRSAPMTSNFLLVSYFKITFEGQLVVIIALYNDPATRREVDYAEVYHGSGRLLGISWLDEFGIRRSAIDYGLIEEEESASVIGVLILVEEGNPV